MDANTAILAEQIGARIRTARLRSGLSVDDVALVLGISGRNLAAMERGELKMAATQIVELCDLFDKKPSWFFET